MKQNHSKQGATIHDVAQYAGVSAMTVSRVVNKSASVSEKMRKKIESAIEELNYVPNLAARAARTGVNKIGIIFSNPKSHNLGDFLMGAFTAGSRLGCELLIEPLPAHPEPLDALKTLINKGVSGVILPPPICDSLEAHQLARKHSVTALSFASGNPKLHSPAVLIDDFAGASAMTHYLIGLGHKKIAFVKGDPSHSPAISRFEGFMVAMAEAGLDVEDDCIFQGDFSYKSGLDVAQTLFAQDKSQRPTAIFAANDEMAAAIIAVAHGMDVKVPEEVSIAGFDDTAIASTVWPQLTTVHQPLQQMAEKAVEILDATLRKTTQEQKHFVAPFKLVERESTGHF
ncbi:LacI family DNA-binding transcriptional regulator [Catenovulum sp. 2E275]|uniref:LacI family DNA-binding transcriptional regulator n=1 Tax=Catenovulum sp. 2E275 TaxID=2980497 RepID=UPI0021CDEE40|nr:LacI family DNA-binding transcriptional regulator [Catenovulum sp. 2E275]MCU4675922.1 LacI family DNA-binding transcriptional regulator [Catenovulum sp. 2E275]